MHVSAYVNYLYSSKVGTPHGYVLRLRGLAPARQPAFLQQQVEKAPFRGLTAGGSPVQSEPPEQAEAALAWLPGVPSAWGWQMAEDLGSKSISVPVEKGLKRLPTSWHRRNAGAGGCKYHS